MLTIAMRLACTLLATAPLLVGQSSTQTSLRDPPVEAGSVVLIRLGLTDNEATEWNGSIRIESGRLLELIGREFRVGDVIHPPNRWEASSRAGFKVAKRLMYEQ